MVHQIVADSPNTTQTQYYAEPVVIPQYGGYAEVRLGRYSRTARVNSQASISAAIAELKSLVEMEAH
jgi:hypothetical protein